LKSWIFFLASNTIVRIPITAAIFMLHLIWFDGSNLC